MKNSRYIIALFVSSVLLLTGCNKQEQEEPQVVPISHVISVQSQTNLGNETENKLLKSEATKANENTTLTYTLEVWTREETPQCIMHKTETGTIDQGVKFDITLVPGVYDFLFWADYDQGRYLTSNLRSVTLIPSTYTHNDQYDAFAYALSAVEWGPNTQINVTLRRPLAKILVSNTETFKAALPVSIKYNGIYTRYDVLTGEVSENSGTENIVYPETIIGTNFIGENFLFVPADGQTTVSISITLGSTIKDITDLPLQFNYQTNASVQF